MSRFHYGIYGMHIHSINLNANFVQKLPHRNIPKVFEKISWPNQVDTKINHNTT
jgi:hypothetical protein